MIEQLDVITIFNIHAGIVVVSGVFGSSYKDVLKEIPTTTNNQQGEATPLTLDGKLLTAESKEIKSITVYQERTHEDSNRLPYQILQGPCATNDIDHESFATDTNISLGASFIPIFDKRWLQKDANISVVINTISSQCIHSCINVYLMTYDDMKCYNDRDSMEQCSYYRKYTSNGTQYNITIGRKLGGELLPPNYYSLVVNSSGTSEIAAQWSFNASYAIYNTSSPSLGEVCSISDSNLTQNCSIKLHGYHDGTCIFISTYLYSDTNPQIYCYKISINKYYVHKWNNQSIPSLIFLIFFVVAAILLFVCFSLKRLRKKVMFYTYHKS